MSVLNCLEAIVHRFKMELHQDELFHTEAVSLLSDTSKLQPQFGVFDIVLGRSFELPKDEVDFVLHISQLLSTVSMQLLVLYSQLVDSSVKIELPTVHVPGTQATRCLVEFLL